MRALNSRERPLKGSRVHLLGVSYKEDVGDLRESPALTARSSSCATAAPRSPTPTRTSPTLPEHRLASAELDGAIDAADCVVIVTAHSGIDYAESPAEARLVVDLRNATGRRPARRRDWKLWKL